jgi:hypothetical protein
MKKGYFFSLEALIAALILMASILIVNSGFSEHSDKESKVYREMRLLEAKGTLDRMSDSELETNLTRTLGFVVEVNPTRTDGAFIKYLVTQGPDKFRIIQIAYQQP